MSANTLYYLPPSENAMQCVAMHVQCCQLLASCKIVFSFKLATLRQDTCIADLHANIENYLHGSKFILVCLWVVLLKK